MNKDPGLAGVFSAIFPGLGQIYNEQLLKGYIFVIITLFVIYLGFTSITYVFLPEDGNLAFIVIIIIYLLVWGISVWEASSSARKINEKAKD